MRGAQRNLGPGGPVQHAPGGQKGGVFGHTPLFLIPGALLWCSVCCLLLYNVVCTPWDQMGRVVALGGGSGVLGRRARSHFLASLTLERLSSVSLCCHSSNRIGITCCEVSALMLRFGWVSVS